MTKNKWVPLAALGVTAAVLCGALLALRNTPEETEETGVALCSLNAGDADSLQCSWEGETLSLVRKDGVWQLEADAKLTLDQGKVETLLTGLTGLQAVRELEDTSQKSEFGLEEPVLECTLTAGEDRFSLTVGAENSVTGDSYAQVAGSDAVYTVKTTDLSKLKKTSADLYGGVDVTDLEKEEISEMTLVTGSETLRFLQEDGTWTLADDETCELDQTALNLMANTVCAMTSTWTITQPEALSAYGLDAPDAIVTVFAADGTAAQVKFGSLSGDGESCYFLLNDEDDLVYETLASNRTAFAVSRESLTAATAETAQAEE
ncbi:MAG: DUF4340 domain-containing protein [Gemmiger sp.]